jgi:hypothetical protein
VGDGDVIHVLQKRRTRNNNAALDWMPIMIMVTEAERSEVDASAHAVGLQRNDKSSSGTPRKTVGQPFK